MDFDCDQKESVHFYIPYSKTKALIETTWISDLNNSSIINYDDQLKDYIKNTLRINNYKVNFKKQVLSLYFIQKILKN